MPPTLSNEEFQFHIRNSKYVCSSNLHSHGKTLEHFKRRHDHSHLPATELNREASLI